MRPTGKVLEVALPGEATLVVVEVVPHLASA